MALHRALLLLLPSWCQVSWNILYWLCLRSHLRLQHLTTMLEPGAIEQPIGHQKLSLHLSRTWVDGAWDQHGPQHLPLQLEDGTNPSDMVLTNKEASIDMILQRFASSKGFYITPCLTRARGARLFCLLWAWIRHVWWHSQPHRLLTRFAALAASEYALAALVIFRLRSGHSKRL